jgi:hypothetical protein
VNGAQYVASSGSSTPLFDAVMAEQGVDLMPLPPTPTHAEFMAARGQDDWLAGLESMLALYERPQHAGPTSKSPTPGVPVKKKGGGRR